MPHGPPGAPAGSDRASARSRSRWPAARRWQQARGPGSRVDVVVSTEPRSGGGRTFLALENVELLALSGAAAPDASKAGSDGGQGGSSATATATATLRVTLRQAVYLTAAQNFAREVRLLPRPAGDRARTGRAGVAADGL